MSSEWQGYDLTEFPELADPEDTIREALRDTIGDGEGIDDAVMQRFISKVKADALREAGQGMRAQVERATEYQRFTEHELIEHGVEHVLNEYADRIEGAIK